MGDRLATVDMGRKWGRAAVVDGSPPGPHLTQWGLAYLFTKWHLDPCNRLATTVGMPRSCGYLSGACANDLHMLQLMLLPPYHLLLQ